MEDSIETEDGGGTRVAMNTKTLLRFIIQRDQREGRPSG